MLLPASPLSPAGLLRVLRRCEEMIQRYSRERSADGAVGKAVEDCMRAIIGVLLNLTHDNG